uniref:Cytochrome c oxidase subunit 7B, mitochondrial n=1 Tax=Gopherus agassizii TaxID=38772 RepID=A0A452I9K2_9SAUR
VFFLVRSSLVFWLLSRGTQWIAARQSHHKHVPDFHDKYGNIILLGGSLFCVSIWGYVSTVWLVLSLVSGAYIRKTPKIRTALIKSGHLVIVQPKGG